MKTERMKSSTKNGCLGQSASFRIPHFYTKPHIFEMQNECVFKELVQLYYIKVQFQRPNAELLIGFCVFTRYFNCYASRSDAFRLRQKVSTDSNA